MSLKQKIEAGAESPHRIYFDEPHELWVKLSEVNALLDEAAKHFPKLPKNPNSVDRIIHSIECLEWFEAVLGADQK